MGHGELSVQRDGGLTLQELLVDAEKVIVGVWADLLTLEEVLNPILRNVPETGKYPPRLDSRPEVDHGTRSTVFESVLRIREKGRDVQDFICGLRQTLDL